MKKIAIFIMVAVLLVGCSGSAYETYRRALEKTMTIEELKEMDVEGLKKGGR